jgi:hypothetical protein
VELTEYLIADWRPSDVALEFLAKDYGISFETLRGIVRRSQAHGSVSDLTSA